MMLETKISEMPSKAAVVLWSYRRAKRRVVQRKYGHLVDEMYSGTAQS